MSRNSALRLVLMSLLVLAVSTGVWIGMGAGDATTDTDTAFDAPGTDTTRSWPDERWSGGTINRDEERTSDEPPDSGGEAEDLQDELMAEEEPEAEPVAGCAEYSGNRLIACQLLPDHGFDAGEMSCLSPLWEHESGWNEYASNPGSGAYGIPQALPGSKMASAGDDWQTNPATQIAWGLSYIADRYGTPCGAWQHFQANNWY